MPSNYATTRCHHIFPPSSTEPAHRCGSPALRHEAHCYYHHPTRKPSANARARRGFLLPIVEDAETLHYALSEVIRRLAANQLDAHRAGQLLYSLQIASTLLTFAFDTPQTWRTASTDEAAPHPSGCLSGCCAT